MLERQIGTYTLKKGKLSLTYLDLTTSEIEKHKIYIQEGGSCMKIDGNPFSIKKSLDLKFQ